MELWISCRTAWIDERVRRLCNAGERRQVVVLGAGLDTRAARLGETVAAGADGFESFALEEDRVRWWEVDHPESQALKLERLAQLPDYPLAAATYCGCDFEADDFLEKLGAAGFDAEGEPSVIVWEGVTMYLTEAAVRSSVRRIASACHPDTVLLFDHVGRKMVSSGAALEAEAKAEAADLESGLVASGLDPESARFRALVSGVGEPFRFGINDSLPFMYDAGFRHVYAFYI